MGTLKEIGRSVAEDVSQTEPLLVLRRESRFYKYPSNLERPAADAVPTLRGGPESEQKQGEVGVSH